MSPPNRDPHSLRPTALTALAVGVSLLVFALGGGAASDNQGTIKVHNPGDVGDESNDPHVGCIFYVEGVNMQATTGTLVIQSWPPTGNMTVVVNTTWIAADAPADGFADHHFLNGPYNLTAGHYKVFVSDAKHDKMKTFWVDCVPPCIIDCGPTTTSTSSSTTSTSATNTSTSESSTTTSSSTSTSATDTSTSESSTTTSPSSTTTSTSATDTSTSESSTTTSDTNTTTTEVPFFPSATALGLGAGGIGLAALLMVRRRL